MHRYVKHPVKAGGLEMNRKDAQCSGAHQVLLVSSGGTDNNYLGRRRNSTGRNVSNEIRIAEVKLQDLVRTRIYRMKLTRGSETGVA